MARPIPEPTLYFRALWEQRGREIAKLGQKIQRQRQAIQELRAAKHNEIDHLATAQELFRVRVENVKLQERIRTLQDANDRLRIQNTDYLITLIKIRQQTPPNDV